MRSTTLRPLLLVPPVVPLLALAAGFLNGTAAYVVGGAIIALYTLLCLPLTLSRVTWKTQEAEEAKGLVPGDMSRSPLAHLRSIMEALIGWTLLFLVIMLVREIYLAIRHR